jgi:hypothetical protein
MLTSPVIGNGERLACLWGMTLMEKPHENHILIMGFYRKLI